MTSVILAPWEGIPHCHCSPTSHNLHNLNLMGTCSKDNPIADHMGVYLLQGGLWFTFAHEQTGLASATPHHPCNMSKMAAAHNDIINYSKATKTLLARLLTFTVTALQLQSYQWKVQNMQKVLFYYWNSSNIWKYIIAKSRHEQSPQYKSPK